MEGEIKLDLPSDATEYTVSVSADLPFAFSFTDRAKLGNTETQFGTTHTLKRSKKESLLEFVIRWEGASNSKLTFTSIQINGRELCTLDSSRIDTRGTYMYFFSFSH